MKIRDFRYRLLPALLLLLLSCAIRPGAARAQGPMQPPAPAQTPQQAPPPPKTETPQQNPNFAITLNVPIVTLDAVVTDDNGNYLEQLKKQNFRVYEDGVQQVLSSFGTGDEPLTVAIVVEYSQNGYGWYLYDARTWSTVFLQQLKQVDWVALESFNIRTNVEVDFTHDKTEIIRGLIGMGFPISLESNLYDAIIETTDRMRDVHGKKAILVLASGRDTFSHLTFDKTMARLKESDVPVFAVGVAEQLALEMESHGQLGTNSLGHIVDNQQMQALAEATGGRAWFPRFDGEVPDIMKEVAANLRFEYSMSYTPSNQATDGKYRKIRIELVDDQGNPLVVNNAKGKKIKFLVHTRQGYTAPKNALTN